jgi:hypothetical protein
MSFQLVTLVDPRSTRADNDPTWNPVHRHLHHSAVGFDDSVDSVDSPRWPVNEQQHGTLELYTVLSLSIRRNLSVLLRSICFALMISCSIRIIQWYQKFVSRDADIERSNDSLTPRLLRSIWITWLRNVAAIGHFRLSVIVFREASSKWRVEDYFGFYLQNFRTMGVALKR